MATIIPTHAIVASILPKVITINIKPDPVVNLSSLEDLTLNTDKWNKKVLPKT